MICMGFMRGKGGRWRIMVLTRRARRRSRGRTMIVGRILRTWGGWGRDGEETGKGAAGCGGTVMLIPERFLWGWWRG